MTRPSFGRLTFVELRKMVDTRAGFWLQASVALLTLAVVVLYALFADLPDQSLQGFLSVAIAPASILLPIVGILLVASEWSQRTALVTFTLVPQRSRVLSAKLAAGLLLGLVAVALSLAAAVLGTLAESGEWRLSGAVFGQTALFVATSMAIGIGFGAALLSSAPAIVLSFLLPLGWTALGSLSFLETPARWLDQTRALSPMTEHAMSGSEWAHAGTALALGMVVPLAVGLLRITRGEVRAA